MNSNQVHLINYIVSTHFTYSLNQELSHMLDTLILVPDRWEKTIKEDLDKDVEQGIINLVPIRLYVEWCSAMVV